ncbi:NitT/TauT family transport system substrate-binding protein [Spinactinospora alkalitolerans]|uniref:Thiamine pyrimidine synthase n=1 Tax=Spinactinospora alkalitolerans TaxID=687207 RepID=A0A852TWA0_9ACTN|nr:ABC transporter substrate-binding protein [Spinactinospora alkalitolerans]NYE47132.1 NitT/TauT family transport system substrate-binding protein [Spinactinospora alkalitolerans]
MVSLISHRARPYWAQRLLSITALGPLLALGACSAPSADLATPGTSTGDGVADHCESGDEVRVVLQWVAQSQFAGYYAAQDQGFYADECLEVTIQEGGVNVVPQQMLSSGNTEFAVSHVTKSMATREEGADLVNIGQIFQRGAYLQVSWADSGLETLSDLEGQKVGSWGFGNDLTLRAAMAGEGMDLEEDTTMVQQPFDMSLLLNRDIDSAQAKTYNEYAQLLEATNPETGELYQPSDFNTINLQDLGYSSLEDGVYARGEWLRDEENQDIATRFLKATFEGWAFCRDHFEECTDIVLDNGSTLGYSHMAWQLNEVNRLIWPSPEGIGAVDEDAWQQTIDIAMQGDVLATEPDAGAYRTDLSEAALEAARENGVDVIGDDYEPEDVELAPGGE